MKEIIHFIKKTASIKRSIIDTYKCIGTGAKVFQNIKLFALSMKENIKIGDSEKDVQDLEPICELSGLSEKVSSLPKGLDTQIYKFYDKEGIEPSRQTGTMQRCLKRKLSIIHNMGNKANTKV